jgi:hypothetical protein
VTPPVLQRELSGALRLKDSQTHLLSPTVLLGGRGLSRAQRRESVDLAQRLAGQLIETNRARLDAFELRAEVVVRRGDVRLRVDSGLKIGAFSLSSPTTGRDDVPVVIEPRFGWSSVGDLLAGAGMAVRPDLLRLPMLPRSERSVPPWVLSTVVLERVAALLASMQRRFSFVEGDLGQPRGTMLLAQWATRHWPQGRGASIPCRYPDLRDDDALLAALHWTLLRQRGSLETQRGHGAVVRQLLTRCAQLLQHVDRVPPRRPSAKILSPDARAARAVRDALEAIGWTADERGLAGLADLSGVPWQLSMESAFEAWVEAALLRLAQRRALSVHAGRTGATQIALGWDRRASMRSLVPDVVARRGDTVLVVDAKYKDHWGAVVDRDWRDAPAQVREHHRADLHQVLAYAASLRATRVIACLAYPLHQDKVEKGAHVRRARVGNHRGTDLVLLGLPLNAPGLETTASIFERILDAPPA